MSLADGVSIVASVLAAAFGGGLAFSLVRAADLRQALTRAREALEEQRGRLAVVERALAATREAATHEIQESRGAAEDLARHLDEARAEDEKKAGWLDHQQEEIDWLRAELEKRPKITRKTYKIITVGMKYTGKTSLTLKWANPLIDLGTLQGTKIERYERTVSHVPGKDVTTEHVFEIGDWGGEHIVDALQELIIDEVHGLLIVVDLGGKDAKVVQPERVQEQLREFQTQSLKFFFAPKPLASCKTVVLFVNKADLLPGTPAEAEAQARKLYARLIEDLSAYQAQVDIRVLVGSANYGHSTHHLFSHFVEKILPKNAYDNQLLQRMKSDLAGTPGPTPALPPKST